MIIPIHTRSLRVAAVALVTALVALTGVALVGNDFRFSERRVSIPGPEGNLDGVMTLPDDGTARGVVLMVHGDAAAEATQDGLYDAWFEGAADAGFATISWSKPGVGGSDGDWLSQSMSDRATEVEAVLDWAQARDDVPTDTIVLWGASQAGWVLPKVVAARADVDGVVAVSPAINWLRQGRFNLLAELDHDKASTQERERAVEESDHTRKLLEQRASYEDYLATTDTADPMSKDRWRFVMRNFGADAESDLVAAGTREIPVHLMVGLHDRNVDVAETEDVYRSTFGPHLTVSRLDGAHSLARTAMEDNDAIGLAAAIIWPRAIFAPRAIDDYSSFLSTIG